MWSPEVRKIRWWNMIMKIYWLPSISNQTGLRGMEKQVLEDIKDTFKDAMERIDYYLEHEYDYWVEKD